MDRVVEFIPYDMTVSSDLKLAIYQQELKINKQRVEVLRGEIMLKQQEQKMSVQDDQL
jgi:hypothetical protein